MAHFAKLGVGNIILTAEAVSNDIATTEQVGVDFLNNLYNTRDVWKQTSYNHNIRKNYAVIGGSYDQARDAFISPQPYPSWTLVEDTCQWNPPITYPDDDKRYTWDEDVYQADNTKGWIAHD